MEIGITWKHKTIYNKDIDVQKTIIKGLQYAGLVAIGTIIYSNTASAVTTAFAEPMNEMLRPINPNSTMKEVIELIENPQSTFINMQTGINTLMDSFNQFVHSVGQF